MKMRPVSPGKRVSRGDIITLQQVVRGGKLSTTIETYHISPTGDHDDACQPKRIPASMPRISPFLDKRIGNVQKVELPGGKVVKLKLTGIFEKLRDDSD